MAKQALLLDRLLTRLRTFKAARGGNVVITFALTLVPVIGFVGAAVDYSRGNSAKAAMQAAVDSTALMLSKEAQNLDSAELNQKATYFNALLNRTEVSSIQVTPTLTTPSQGSFKLDVTATGTVAANFTKIIGKQQLNIDVHSEVLWGIKKLELALALDNTGSMAQAGKMSNLK